MNEKQKVVALVSGLIGQESLLTINKVILKKLNGDKNTALLLTQIMYWSKTMNKEWFYKTDESWREELFLSEWELRSSKEKLKRMGLIDTKLKRATGLTILHYSINYNKIYDFLTSDLSVTQKRVCVRLKSESECDSNALHRLHTENTTKNKENNKTVKSEKRDFTESPIKPSLFYSVKNKPRDTYAEQILSTFLKEHQKRYPNKHKIISDEKMVECLIKLNLFVDLIEEDFEDKLDYIITEFFNKRFRDRNCDYSLILFTDCFEAFANRSRGELY